MIRLERRARIGGRLSPTARAAKIKEVLDAAVKSGDLTSAITQLGTGLNERDLTSLRNLTASELRTMARVRQKLARIGIEERADNNIIY